MLTLNICIQKLTFWPVLPVSFCANRYRAFCTVLCHLHISVVFESEHSYSDSDSIALGVSIVAAFLQEKMKEQLYRYAFICIITPYKSFENTGKLKCRGKIVINQQLTLIHWSPKFVYTAFKKISSYTTHSICNTNINWSKLFRKITAENAYRPVAKRWLCKQRPLLCNGWINTFPLPGSRFLILQDYNNGHGVFSTWSVPRCYNQDSLEHEFSCETVASRQWRERMKLKNLYC
jgi:hypothetical protein